MKLSELEELRARVARILGKLDQKAGPGTGWECTFPDGSTTKYEITNVKALEEIQDAFENLAVWTWAIKDYIKDIASTLGSTPRAIEKYVDSDPDLPMCADLANLAKHARLTRSRSGQWPISVKSSYVIKHDPRHQRHLSSQLVSPRIL